LKTLHVNTFSCSTFLKVRSTYCSTFVPDLSLLESSCSMCSMLFLLHIWKNEEIFLYMVYKAPKTRNNVEHAENKLLRHGTDMERKRGAPGTDQTEVTDSSWWLAKPTRGSSSSADGAAGARCGRRVKSRLWPASPIRRCVTRSKRWKRACNGKVRTA